MGYNHIVDLQWAPPYGVLSDRVNKAECIMDRREFGKMSLGTVAATAASASHTSAMAQDAVSPRAIAQLPPESRALLEQSFPRFSDSEYARRERLLGDVIFTDRL